MAPVGLGLHLNNNERKRMESQGGGLFFLNENASLVIRRLSLKSLEKYIPSLPCWVPHREIAAALGHSFSAIEAAERSIGGKRYRWATEFENVHSVWIFEEKGFMYRDVHWKGSEQLFQCLKWGSTHFDEHKAEYAALSPMESYELGRTVLCIDDIDVWNKEGRIKAMRLALRLKFSSDDRLRRLLLDTGDDRLVSIKGDCYWGIGLDGSGENMLGVLLEELRLHFVSQNKVIQGKYIKK